MSDEKVNVFEHFDDPDSYLLPNRKKREYEKVKAYVHIGDDYFSVKSLIESQLNFFKHYCTSYTDYELSSPTMMPDGTFYVDCSFIEVACLCGPDDPQLFCRLYFDSEQKLTSIEELVEVCDKGLVPITRLFEGIKKLFQKK